MKTYYRFCVFSLVYALVIILWGAFVRVSGSGDGCGKHWPLCQGYIVPQGEILLSLQTWIEYFHRVKSGLFGILILFLWIYAFRNFSKDSHLRKSAHFVFAFTVSEALIGAGLVLFGLVDQDQSTWRVLIGGLHLVNTFGLLGSLVALCFFARLHEEVTFVWRNQRSTLVAFCSFAGLCVLGHWASLASQLYPSTSLWEGLLADFSSESAFIVRWRVLHPVLALLSLGLIGYWYAQLRPSSLSVSFQSFFGFLIAAMCIGVMTWFFLAPVWMKLFHLLTTDMIWIMMCLGLLEDGTLNPIGMQAIRSRVEKEEKVLSHSPCSS